MLLYRLYYIFTLIAHFIVPTLLKRRLRAGKENPDRYQEKLGHYSIERPKGDLIWFHAASVGELNSIIPIIKKLGKVSFLITTVTLNSSKVFERANIKNAIHQFAPVDSPFIIKKFLDYWQPKRGIFIDSEIWPNLICIASERFDLINLNARISRKSTASWARLRSLINLLYNKFSHIYPCSKADMARIKTLTDNKHVKYIGNIKYMADAPACDPKKHIEYMKKLTGKKIVVAASTHPGEEDYILNAMKPIFASHPELFLIIAPRDPSRSADISASIKKCGLSYAVRSQNEDIKRSQVYIADTIGEMGLWYRLSELVIMGGTILYNGHNIIEPAQLNNAIIIGQNYWNFEDVVEDFMEENAVKIVSSEDDMTTKITDFIKSDDLLSIAIKRAKKVCDTHSDSKLLMKELGL